MEWDQKKVLVTGGASFISSHLIDLLVEKGARDVRVKIVHQPDEDLVARVVADAAAGDRGGAPSYIEILRDHISSSNPTMKARGPKP